MEFHQYKVKSDHELSGKLLEIKNKWNHDPIYNHSQLIKQGNDKGLILQDIIMSIGAFSSKYLSIKHPYTSWIRREVTQLSFKNIECEIFFRKEAALALTQRGIKYWILKNAKFQNFKYDEDKPVSTGIFVEDETKMIAITEEGHKKLAQSIIAHEENEQDYTKPKRQRFKILSGEVIYKKKLNNQKGKMPKASA